MAQSNSLQLLNTNSNLGRFLRAFRSGKPEGTLCRHKGKFLQKVLMDVLKEAGLLSTEQSLPAPVRVKHGKNKNGRTLHFYLNYSSEPQTFGYWYSAGEELLTQSSVTHDQKLTLKPWDVAIVEEK